MHVLLMTMGSTGDVHPFLRMGAELRNRGHKVTLATSEAFKPLADAEGIDFESFCSHAEFEEIISDPRLWQPRRGTLYFARHAILPFMQKQFELIERMTNAGECDVVLAPGVCLGARIAQEKLGVKLSTVQLSPYYFRSVYRNRRVPGIVMPDWFPHSWKRTAFRLVDTGSDYIFGREVNRFRSELGLPPAQGIFWEWWNSPELILAMFPEWFAPRQPDWPTQTQFAGFPLYDNTPDGRSLEHLEQFLTFGDPPIVFTPGTAMLHAQEFFAAAQTAITQLDRRAIFLTRCVEQLPTPLSSRVLHLPYLPFRHVLPRAGAIVHHGGIGTTAHALAAGVPQLVTSYGFDQVENGSRIVDLGAGLSLSTKQVSAAKLTCTLREVLRADREQRCREISKWVRDGQEMASTLEAVENLVPKRQKFAAVGVLPEPTSSRS